MSYTLYSYWRSSASWRVRIVLAYKGIPYEYANVDLGVGGQREDSWTEKNPMGQVPLLVTEQGNITQSVAICDFLERTHPEPSMVPTDPILRARMT